MGLDDMKTDLEKAAGPVDDKAKEMVDQAKDKFDDMTGNKDDHSKGGDVNKSSDQQRSDYDDSSTQANRAPRPYDAGDTGVDDDEEGFRSSSTAEDLDDNPMDYSDNS